MQDAALGRAAGYRKYDIVKAASKRFKTVKAFRRRAEQRFQVNSVPCHDVFFTSMQGAEPPTFLLHWDASPSAHHTPIFMQSRRYRYAAYYHVPPPQQPAQAALPAPAAAPPVYHINIGDSDSDEDADEDEAVCPFCGNVGCRGPYA